MSEEAVTTELVLRALLFATLRQMTIAEQIAVLDRAGWSNPQIGGAVGLTSNAVKLRKRAKHAK